jgi:hypothetical protein
MHLASHRVLRRASTFCALVALLGLAAVSLTQCTMVNDNVTGLSFSVAKANKCLKECKRDFDSATREEMRLNHRNRRQCDSDVVCLALESERHRTVLKQIEKEYETCRSECHHQGGGGGQ